MQQARHKDLSALLDFYIGQRDNLPEDFTYSQGLIDKPCFFTVKDLQNHLNNPLLRPEWVHIKTAGRDVLLDSVLLKKIVQRRPLQFIDKEKINQELGKGCAVVLEGLDILDPEINAFCAQLDNKLPCGLSNSVAFFSQANNEAYLGHCDSDDVLVVQLAGAKTWHLFAPQQRRYFGTQNLNDSKLGPVKHAITLQPGDALYVRAGVPHRCITEGEFSLHMSFDLIDRTPGVDYITQEANKRYGHACELPYAPGAKVVDKYMKILQSSEFRSELSAKTLKTRMELADFRKCLGRSSGVQNLSKFM